jgi:hypothetical protein
VAGRSTGGQSGLTVNPLKTCVDDWNTGDMSNLQGRADMQTVLQAAPQTTHLLAWVGRYQDLTRGPLEASIRNHFWASSTDPPLLTCVIVFLDASLKSILFPDVTGLAYAFYFSRVTSVNGAYEAAGEYGADQPWGPIHDLPSNVRAANVRVATDATLTDLMPTAHRPTRTFPSPPPQTQIGDCISKWNSYIPTDAVATKQSPAPITNNPSAWVFHANQGTYPVPTDVSADPATAIIGPDGLAMEKMTNVCMVYFTQNVGAVGHYVCVFVPPGGVATGALDANGDKPPGWECASNTDSAPIIDPEPPQYPRNAILAQDGSLTAAPPQTTPPTPNGAPVISPIAVCPSSDSHHIGTDSGTGEQVLACNRNWGSNLVASNGIVCSVEITNGVGHEIVAEAFVNGSLAVTTRHTINASPWTQDLTNTHPPVGINRCRFELDGKVVGEVTFSVS